MTNTMPMVKNINECFGLSLSMITNYLSVNQPMVSIDSNIYKNIVDRAEKEYGHSLLKFSISPENYMRYKNGKISSIVRGDSGFQRHEGFEAVKMVNIVDSIFTEVSQYYTANILQELNNLSNQIFSAINSFQSQVLGQAIYLREQDHIEELSSYKDFFNEINEELGEISTSPERATAYISNIINIRTKIFKIYSHFIKKLENWPNTINSWDIYGNYQYINFQLLQNDYYFCRQAISCYMICLVYEHVISGNIDSKSFDKISNKTKRFIEKFNFCDTQIKNALTQRDQSNRSWSWYYRPEKQADSDSITWFLHQCQREPNFEIIKLKELSNSSKLLLNNIILIDEDQDKR